MGSNKRLLRHLPFFEALVQLDESSPEWRAVSAGLVTLRLVDAWVSEGPHVAAADSWTLRSVRDAIAAVDQRTSMRALLASLVDAMTAAVPVRVSTLAPRLMAYARALQFDAQWSLAADVYQCVVSHAHPVEDADIIIAAHLHLGTCHRRNAQWQDAAAAFTIAGQVAGLRGDVMGVLRSRMYEADIAMDRGNFPQAEAIFEETITRARSAGNGEVIGLALHGRAGVAIRRGDYELSVRLGYEALNLLAEPAARDRVLSDLATSFLELGVRSAARDAHLILAATAQEQYVRWAATLNLMEIAALDGREPVFEQYRRELADASLPAKMAAHYHLYVGRGYRMFQRLDAARASLERAIELAVRSQINDVLIIAERTLEEIKDGGVVIIAATPEPAPAVREVATALREMRTMAGVGT
ncbi:MAG: hypothetical protein M3068_03815 [Gemmatimonadota bacterium]|nr:hypothetical protein [Gemmatimonadota bacterium]